MLSKKNILVLGNGNPREIGGVEAFCRNLDNWFKDDIEFLFCAIYKDADKKKFKLNNVVELLDKHNILHRLFNRFTFGRGVELLATKKIPDKKFDAVILNSPRFIDIALKYSSNIFLVQHMSVPVWWKKNIHFNSSKIVLNKCIEHCRFIALSEFDKEKMVSYLSVPKEKISVIRNGCGVSKLEELKLDNNKILMLSRFDNRTKRFDLIIKAMTSLPTYELHIYGEGDDKDHLLNLSEGIDNVFIHNSTNNIQNTLDRHSILACVSDNEGYPVSCIEAMFRGLPIICRETFVSSRDIVVDNGILLGSNWIESDFLAGIIEISNNYSKYSKKSLELSDRHSSHVLMNKWKNILLGNSNI